MTSMDNIADEHPTHSSEWCCYNPNYNCRYRQPRFLNRKNSHKTARIPPSIKAKKDAIVRTIHKLPFVEFTLAAGEHVSSLSICTLLDLC